MSSNFYGFHGDRMSADRSGLFTGPATGAMRTRKSSSAAAAQRSRSMMGAQQSLPNPMLQANPNQMTYNGMYNVAAVAPPPIGQKPARRSTRQQQQQQQQHPYVNAPPTLQQQQQQPVIAVLPINRPAPPQLPQPTMSTVNAAMSELQAKVMQWKEKRAQSSHKSPPPMPDVTVDDDTAVAMDHEEYSNEQPPPPAKATTDDAALERYKTEVNRSVDSVRREVADLRKEIVALADSVKLLNPGVIRGVEQQVQKVMVDYNRITATLEQVQLIAKAQQNQVDEMMQTLGNRKDEHGVTSQELEDILDGVAQETKKNLTDLENSVKTSLQNISDRSHWIYGVVLQDTVGLYESHELVSRRKSDVAKGDKIQLTYPMKRTHEGVWMKVRTVAEDGSLSVSWVPIWTYTAEVLKRFAGTQPPAEEAKIINVGGFTLC